MIGRVMISFSLWGIEIPSIMATCIAPIQNGDGNGHGDDETKGKRERETMNIPILICLTDVVEAVNVIEGLV